MPFPFLAIAMLASAGAGLTQGVLQSRAAGKASQAEIDANNKAAELERQSAKEALEFQRQAYQQSRSDLQPWMDVGRSALYKASDMLRLPRSSSPMIPQYADTGGVKSDQPNTTRLIGPDGKTIVDSPSTEQTNFLLSQGYKPTGVTVAPQGGQSQPMQPGQMDWNKIAAKYRGGPRPTDPNAMRTV